MKKTVLSFALIFAALFSLVLPVHAQEPGFTTVKSADGGYVVYYEDGSYLTVSPAYRTGTDGEDRGMTTVIVEHKDAAFTNSDGELEWKYTLNGTFSYTYGVSATCTNASYSQTIYKGNWTFSNGSATASGATARGVGHYEKKFLFITIQSADVDITLVCDKYGNVV